LEKNQFLLAKLYNFIINQTHHYNLKIFLTAFICFFFSEIHSQTKIIFTAIDYTNDEVRATICDGDGSNRNELGFNKTYLPAWFNDKVLLNSDTFIWQCDTSGANLTKLFPGYRVSISNNKRMFAFYNQNGIGVSDDKGRIIKQIMVNAFEDVAITWSKKDDRVSYFDPDKKICYLFNLINDSLEIFGDSIYHPMWNPQNHYVLYNRASADDKFDIYLQLADSADSKFIINKKDENAVVPIWSNSGNKIAYLSFKTVVQNSPESDLYPCNLMLYDVGKRSSQILSGDASFTDKAFPQICFDEKDEYIYFTKINEAGLGSIARINLKTLQQETISKDSNLDERFPSVKNF
jgi:hypothetical protein